MGILCICVTNDHGTFVVPQSVPFPIDSCIKSNLRRGPYVEHELCTLPEHLSSLSVFGGVRVDQSCVFCVVFCHIRPFVFFLLAIALSVLLQFTTSHYPFGNFKHFFLNLILFVRVNSLYKFFQCITFQDTYGDRCQIFIFVFNK